MMFTPSYEDVIQVMANLRLDKSLSQQTARLARGETTEAEQAVWQALDSLGHRRNCACPKCKQLRSQIKEMRQ